MRIDSAPGAPLLVSPRTDRGADIRKAAEQFEALFIGHMLRSMRESQSDDAEGAGDANSTFLEVAEEQLAQALSARGGLGIATMVTTSLGQAK